MNEPNHVPEPPGPSPEGDRTVIASTMRGGESASRTDTPGAPMTAGTAATVGHNTLPPGTLLGEFEIVGLIGEGGFGIVYLALDTSLGRHVALKEYMPSALAARVNATEVQVKSERHEGTFRAGLKSFINEARILAQFDHHSLVKVYRFWEANGTAYMVMPYYRGVTLKEALKARATPPDERWLRTLLAPVLDALSVLHASNCYHRDVAPDNIILLEGSGRPVLLDFGAARRVIGDMTQALTVILKPGYAPIEQYAEVPSLRQGAWSDGYALAAVVYFAIVGKTPPPSVGRMVSDSYQPLVTLAAGRYSERFLRAVDHALAVTPDKRPQTMQQFAEELGVTMGEPERDVEPVAQAGKARFAAGGKADGKAAASGAQGTSLGRRHGMWTGVGVAALAVAAAAGVGTWLLREPGRTPTATLAPASGSASANAASGTHPSNAAHGTGGGNQTTSSTNPTSPASTIGTIGTNSTNIASGSGGLPPAPAASSGQAGTASADVTLPPYTASGELSRIAQLADPGIAVKVDLPLTRAVVGRDLVRFTLTSNHAGYVYVFLVDPANEYTMLFPNEIDQNNRIAASKPLALPGRGWALRASKPLGDNYFVAIVSPVPRDFSRLGMDAGSSYASLSPAAQNAAAAQRTASSSPFAGIAQCDDTRTPCPQQYGAVAFKIKVVGSSK
jgi:hypothetical protein